MFGFSIVKPFSFLKTITIPTIFSVFIIIIYFTVKYLLNLGSSPLIHFVIYK